MMISKIIFTFVFLFSSLIWNTDAFSMDASDIWKGYQELHLKEYTKSEIDNKLTNFHESTTLIVEHNIEADLKKHSFWIGLNHFSHMNKTEREKLLNCFPDDDPSEVTPAITFNRTVEGIPENYDCREMHMVTSVKNQGSCPVCWVFAALVSLEGLWAKTNGVLQDLSEQNGVDCIQGCLNGFPSQLYSYVKQNNGIDTYKSYPYDGIAEPCRFKPNNVGATCSGYDNLGSENDIQSAVYERGPVSVGIFSSDSSEKFNHYKHGVYDSSNCAQRADHAIGVVGFGTDDVSGKPYWILKNSWGENWGENGFVRMVRNKNMCSITQLPEIVDL